MARTVPLCLAVAVGMTILVPAAPALASESVVRDSAAATCSPTLDEDQMEALFEQIEAATDKRVRGGARLSLSFTMDDLSLSLRMIMDGVSKRVETTMTAPDMPTLRTKYLPNGYGYQYVTSAHADEKPALAVLHKSSGWLNTGTEDSPWADILTTASGSSAHALQSVSTRAAKALGRPVQSLLDEADAVAQCTATETGLTITFTDEDGTGIGTLKTGADYSLVSYVIEGDGISMRETVTYGANPVADIPVTQRIRLTNWSKATSSAQQRGELLTWGKSTAEKAKRLAAKLNRTVRASDVQAATRKWPLYGTRPVNLSRGVRVTMIERDVYTGDPLQVQLTVSDRTVKVAHSW
jgi:hypothetical protein